jgi:hypothetical protein
MPAMTMEARMDRDLITEKGLGPEPIMAPEPAMGMSTSLEIFAVDGSGKRHRGGNPRSYFRRICRSRVANPPTGRKQWKKEALSVFFP